MINVQIAHISFSGICHYDQNENKLTTEDYCIWNCLERKKKKLKEKKKKGSHTETYWI